MKTTNTHRKKNSNKTRKRLILVGSAIALCSVQVAKADWTAGGPSGMGGKIITLGDTGTYGLSTGSAPVFLSSGGGDIITIAPGGTTAGLGALVIDIEDAGAGHNQIVNNGLLTTSSNNVIYIDGDTGAGNSILNNGTISQTSGSDAIEVYSFGASIVNSATGLITTTSTGSGIYIEGGSSVVTNFGIINAYYGIDAETTYGLTINNYGTIDAKSGYGIYYYSSSNGIINNWGTIQAPLSSGYGVAIYDAHNTTINNYATGMIIGGNGYGMEISAATNITLNNWGTIKSLSDEGIYLYSVYGSTINNWGSIIANDTGISAFGYGNVINNWGTIQSTSSYGLYFDTFAGSTLNNWGTISGGGSGSVAIYHYSSHGSVINNWGTIQASGDGGDIIAINFEDAYGVRLNNYGLIQSGPSSTTSAGVFLNYALGNTINNWGTIQGATAGIYASDAYGNVINNWGTIAALDRGLSGSSASEFAGIYLSSAHGNIINNWGVITNGQGPSGNGIYLENGSHNIINLNGHSSVIGKITVTDSYTDNSNVVNLNFTGVDVATLAKLKASLAAQGAGTGKDTDATFTLRGVTYVIDPALVNFNMSSYQLQGLTGNQQAVGANLDSMLVNPTGNMMTLVNAIDNSGNVPGALEALSPLRYQVLGDIAISNSTFNTLQIDQRLNNRRNGSEGIDTSGFRVAESDIQNRLGFAGAKGRGGKQIAPPAKGQAPMQSDSRWGAFLSGNAVFGDLEGRGELGDANFTSAGVMLGADYRFSEDLVGGAFLGYSRTEADLDGIGSDANVDTYSIGLYGGWHRGPYYVNALASYAHNEYDTNRRIVFPGLDRFAGGSTAGDQFTINIDGGYDYVVNDRVIIGPIAGLQYVRVGVDGFTETPGVGSLTVNDNDLDSLRSRLGARIQFSKSYSNDLRVALEARASWQHEFLNDNAISASFTGSGLAAFSVERHDPGSDTALVGAGVNVTWRQNYTFFADYDAQVGNDVLQSIKGGVKISF